MTEAIISKFEGLAPRFSPNLKEGVASIAENVDLSNGKINPLAAHLLNVADTNYYNSLKYFNDGWQRSNDAFYCEWKINTLDILFYLASGVMKKNVNGVVANVGQTRLTAPVLSIATTKVDLTGVLYDWTAAGHGTNEYYCVLAAGGDPSLAHPDRVDIAGAQATEGTLATLAAGEWGYGDHETLGYSTVYVRLSDGTDPDTKTAGYIITIDNPGVLDGDYTYLITTTRNVNGHIDESGPSASADITVDIEQVTVTRPTISDSNVTYWNIYRTVLATGVYQLVASVLAATASYNDNIAEDALGDAISTWYTSDQGNEIIFDAPISDLDGLIQEPISGILFTWKGPTLYWSEPGYPDAWPSYYSLNFPSNIKVSLSCAGTVAVLTEKGPFRVDGTHPELLQQSKMLGKEPCLSTAGCVTQKGVVYFSDCGLVLFNLVATTVISDSHFTETWFKENVIGGRHMVENEGILYLFHSKGTLVLDNRVNPPIWTTLSTIAFASTIKENEGEVYIIDSEGIKKLHKSGTHLAWIWKSGDILLKTPVEKTFRNVEVIGSGAVSLSIYVDDVLKATKALLFGNERNRSLGFPEGSIGRAAQFMITGTGEVNEVITRGY